MKKTITGEPQRVRLELREIETDTNRFQFRHSGLDEVHAKELARVIKDGRNALDPIWVWLDPATGRPTVVSGHHRLEAYRLAKWNRKVPALLYRCSEREAKLLAAAGNKKQHKPMTLQERMDMAWSLVCDAESSKREINEATTVSNGQIGNMRSTRRQLMEADEELPPLWWMAQNRLKGLGAGEWSEEDKEAMIEAQAAALDAKIGEALGVAAKRWPEAVAQVIQSRLGRRGVELLADELGWLTDASFYDDAESEEE